MLRILVRTPNWIGDHVMAIPFYSALRAEYPKSEITFVCPESLKDFMDDNYRDHKLLLKTRTFSRQLIEQSWGLRNKKYDLGFSLPASWSAASLLFLAGVKNRIGFAHDGSGTLLTHALNWRGQEGNTHKSHLYLSLLEAATGRQTSFQIPFPTFAEKENSIVFAPGASLPLREYPYFCELLLLLSQNYPNYKLVLVGGKTEEKYRTRLNRLNLSNVEDKIGKTTLSEVVEICRKARMVICNDSGIAHLSATLAGTKTFVLMGPGNPEYILPLGGTALPIRLQNLPCSPCEKPYCRAAYGYQTCLKGLLPETVLSEMKTLTL